MDGLRVLELFPANDHQYNAFEVVDAISRPYRHCPCAWHMAKVNIGKFIQALRTGRAALEDTLRGGSATADTVVNSIMVATAYDASMPWRPPYIAGLQEGCH